MTAATLTTCSRDTAVRRIAARLADRTHYVMSVPPPAIVAVATGLRDVPDWSAYLDAGLPAVMRCHDARALAVLAVLSGPMCAVVTVPKTVPPDVLSTITRTEVPADGSRDVLIVHLGEDVPMIWPLLFVDALAVLDPAVAAQIRAYDISATN